MVEKGGELEEKTLILLLTFWASSFSESIFDSVPFTPQFFALEYSNLQLHFRAEFSPTKSSSIFGRHLLSIPFHFGPISNDLRRLGQVRRVNSPEL